MEAAMAGGRGSVKQRGDSWRLEAAGEFGSAGGNAAGNGGGFSVEVLPVAEETTGGSLLAVVAAVAWEAGDGSGWTGDDGQRQLQRAAACRGDVRGCCWWLEEGLLSPDDGKVGRKGGRQRGWVSSMAAADEGGNEAGRGCCCRVGGRGDESRGVPGLGKMKMVERSVVAIGLGEERGRQMGGAGA